MRRNAINLSQICHTEEPVEAVASVALDAAVVVVALAALTAVEAAGAAVLAPLALAVSFWAATATMLAAIEMIVRLSFIVLKCSEREDERA